MATSIRVAQLCIVMVLVLGLCSTMVQARRGSVNLCPGSASRGTCTGPINCFRADPVCGANGVTYGCGCPEAACARSPLTFVRDSGGSWGVAIVNSVCNRVIIGPNGRINKDVIFT
ncbi:hypothetical protein NC653_033079 [Populus alba x Populus x berolinensis]|uniref:Uncharacterized protein n=1 Tax=Populus alba x Populus x berolinensis TaxID=444605 RepID=A0AAD6PZT8_9ROSI|nr:hypothetical protein NC653_033079 [Populus alba x Populus x berolinensis]